VYGGRFPLATATLLLVPLVLAFVPPLVLLVVAIIDWPQGLHTKPQWLPLLDLLDDVAHSGQGRFFSTIFLLRSISYENKNIQSLNLQLD